ncbi:MULTISPECIES: sensor histidine kinase [unclassified Agarivorans]|uniref:sensor histidine kinase n=1 Tax=unclassified Agarivorans TaxID=2636026 RepID=UPI0010D4A97A|nr:MULTISPECIES: HAMP domain-containing sensor histidine kinase [unclassified Agarivorans]MDO6685041.1 HAMP domain-containing sensor histidine kinase [Agarivorans sp. 3_MG-2023]MDO6717401.1 HAMP domain-containing sensor histidine kinase [Agarivorans sp. 2_MG-2023]MDO6765310.1 HAMP domain-containing sensor histidine kinase [Agarivorans sp. 1_MG-2023]GDY27375.1 sensor histidine kinase [Agarivorans sp. Toyoura001]
MPLNDKLDFSSVLATAVHDMKNSLGMLTQSTEAIALRSKQNGREDSEELSRLHYEVSRLNGSLMQLLALYRFEKKQLPMTIEENYLEDLLNDVYYKNKSFIEQTQMKIDIEVDESLSWYFDVTLIEYLLSDVVINALRYSKKQIKISAKQADNYLCIQVDDDGDGFPQSIIDLANAKVASQLDFVNNRSGLGLFFAKLIAKAHINSGKEGRIHIENGSFLGGSRFSLYLP